MQGESQLSALFKSLQITTISMTQSTDELDEEDSFVIKAKGTYTYVLVLWLI